ncbi:hypothetical protein OG203_14865 [Nocardia sp. NBC_01499]|uniref:poly(ethylene terephthalate) hydrolase family protein n=1 Tax=Nocardia sp. NBC_01499 TaxID=2903597 RepID=UPI00386503BA
MPVVVASAANADPDTRDLDTLFGGMGSHQVIQTAATMACPGPGALSGENMVVPRRCQGTFPSGPGSPVGVQYYYPADIDQLGRAPSIVFTPGILAEPGFYDAMLKQWASYGFVVAVSFDYFNTMSEMQFAGLAGLKERDLDPASPLAGKVDFGRILLAGHSAGGGSALLASNIAPRFHALDATFQVVGSLAMEPGPLAATNFVPTPTLIIQNARDSVVPAGGWVDWYQYPGLGAAPAYVATRKAVTHNDVENALLALNAEHSLALAWLLTVGMRDPVASQFFVGPDWKLPGEPNYANVRRSPKADQWQLAPPAGADTIVGARTVTGPIEQTFLETGGQVVWGAPLDDVRDTADGGQFQRFERGVFYRKPNVNGGKAYAVNGPILAKWGELGWERGPLGYPTSDVYTLSTGGFVVPLIGYFGDTPGRWSKFEHGVIYWTEGTGAHPISGPIYDIWRKTGYESGSYGYPIGDDYRTPDGGIAQRFQRGTITVTP